MTPREVTSTWLPSTEQVMVAPERAILAALDATLQLTIRTIIAEHAALAPDGRLDMDPDDEPHTYELLPVAEALVACAKRLGQLVTQYRAVEDALLREPDGASELPHEDNVSPIDDEIPF
jgi:hypothetical protein